MAISLVRIDDRLIHGQIIQGWLKGIDIDIIAVASDIVVKDLMWQTLMSISVPVSVELKVDSVSNIADAIICGDFENKRTMILASSPRDILFMLKKGARFASINVGGMHHTQGKKEILFNIYADDGDINDLKEISQMGIELEGRLLPGDDKTDVVSFIKKYEKK
ncbi:MAG: PTS sugar transporter subunit IIB [Elusimicrobiota bacterium]|jgi:mannose/fructose/N-acetylgalactosamine-specific phosphotransferase system component IIB|nr:PTS sugar transporter subunit IIB [Elusimicrobiota bacterium]